MMVVWGGNDGTNVVNTGGRYDPATDSWTPTSTTNAPEARAQHTAVGTGSEMIVWGGTGNSGDLLNTGGKYCVGAPAPTPTPTATPTPRPRPPRAREDAHQLRGLVRHRIQDQRRTNSRNRPAMSKRSFYRLRFSPAARDYQHEHHDKPNKTKELRRGNLGEEC